MIIIIRIIMFIKTNVPTVTRDSNERNNTNKHFRGYSTLITIFTHFLLVFFQVCFQDMQIYSETACFSILYVDYVKIDGWDVKCPPILE